MYASRENFEWRGKMGEVLYNQIVIRHLVREGSVTGLARSTFSFD